MREGPRRLLMRLLWGALLVAASVYAGLRIGRPVYYTDGQRVVAGADLAGAGMVEWPTPEVVAELPGPVQGRVARLRDGRLLYGRSLPGGSTDLVLFDPARPAVPPEPAFALNSPHHELAPAVGADGRIWFASDRPGGAGGYDLYVARSTGAGFGAPEPVAAANSPLDECDPAPAPDGSALVFVRIEAQRAAGDGGVLLTWRPGGTDPPRPLFEEPAPRRRGAGAVDRDPAFAADGGALWFVRRQQRGGLSLLRASCCNGEFAAPEVVGAGWGVADLRAPSPSGDGFELGLLQARSGDGDASLWFRSRAREVYPWWPGQRWLEWLLLGFAGTCLLLLVLLHLGRRWRALDLLAQCLLVSLLLHVLLLLWLMGVEITGALLRGRDDGGGLRVELVAQADAGTAGTAGQRLVDLAAEVRFDPAVRELAAAAPEVALERPAEAAPQAPEGNREVQHGPSAVTATAVLLDAAAAADPLRAGSDAPAAIAARELAAMAAPAAAAARPAAAPASSSQQAVVVVLPGVSLAAGAEVAAPLPGPPVAGAAFPAARAAPVAAAELRDRAAADAAVQRGEAAAQGVVPFAAAAAQIVAVAPAGTAAAVREPAPAEALEGSGRAPTAPATALAGAGHELVPPLPTRAPAPQPARRSGAAAVALRDPAPAAAVGAPAAADAAVTIARSPQRIALAAPAPVAAAVAAARTLPAADPARAAPPAGPVPGAALARADEPPAAAAGSMGLAMPRSGRQPARRPPALRDGGRALAAEVGAGIAAAGREAEVQPVATGALAPRSAAVVAAPDLPSPGDPAAAPPPASLLARAAAGDLAGPAVRPDRPAAPARPGPRSQLREPTPVAAAAARAFAAPARPALPLPIAGATVPGRSPARRFDRGELGLGAADSPWIPAAPPGSLLERAATAPLGPGAREPARPASAYSNRFGPAKAKALEQFGGTVETERAVADGLRYLASIQNADGSFGDVELFDAKYGSMYVGKTALCVLAFLGAGHTPVSGTEHSRVVARAIARLLAAQDPATGAFGDSSSYGHGIASYALAECHGLTRDPALLPPLERALDWILQNQGPRRDRRNRGGWGYFSPQLPPEDDYARVSVTAWMVMALESARLSGIELPPAALSRAREYLQLSFDAPDGWFRYNHKPSRLASAWPTLPASTPAGAFCLLLLGSDAADPMVAAALDYTVARRPEAYRRYSDDDFVLRGQGNVYFWYYGTLCCFLAGGDAWSQWNERLRTVLPAAQARDGSFPPIDTYAREAGDGRRDRSYTTAMCVLSLEVYYRYFTPLLLGR